MLTLCLLQPLASAAQIEEADVKLALTYNLARFVTWPEESRDQDRFLFCIYGDNPFGAMLHALSDRSLHERPIVVENLAESAEGAAGCDIVFIGDAPTAHIDTLILSIRDKPVLSIGAELGFADRGGIIELRTVDDRVRFVINPAAAQLTRLEFSAQLLELAMMLNPGDDQ